MSKKVSSFWLQSFHSKNNNSLKKDASFNAKTVCITGGKGGVGKTSIALKLSLELNRYGKKVLLIDCDHNLSNTAIKLGLTPNDNFLKLINDEITFNDALYKQGNFHLLSGCNGSMYLFNGSYHFETYFSNFISSQKKFYDYIILDSPAGITNQTVFFASYCDERIFILNPDRSAITDAYSLIKIIKNKFGIKENFLIVNKVQDRGQFERVVKTISETAENYLNVRSYILGGIVFHNTEHENFDRYFLSGQKNLLNRNFIMILNKFLEKSDGKGLWKSSLSQHQSSDLYQSKFC